jgi:hypothetical protein
VHLPSAPSKAWTSKAANIRCNCGREGVLSRLIPKALHTTHRCCLPHWAIAYRERAPHATAQTAIANTLAN